MLEARRASRRRDSRSGCSGARGGAPCGTGGSPRGAMVLVHHETQCPVHAVVIARHRIRPEAVFGADFAGGHDTGTDGDADPQVPVFSAPSARRVEAAGGIERRAPEQHTDRRPEGVAREDVVKVRFGAGDLARDPGAGQLRRKLAVAAVHGADVGVREQRHLRLQVIRQPAIVGVEQSDDVAARDGDPMIARRGQAGIGLSHHSHLLAVRGGDSGGAVVRPVVDHHDLAVRVGLRQGTVHRFSKELRLVVTGDDHAHQRTTGQVCHGCHGRRVSEGASRRDP
jgi:hypothetical protein